MNRTARTLLFTGLLGSIVAASAAFGPTTRRANDETENSKSPVKAEVGEKAPDFTLTDLNGKKHSLTDYEGKIVVLEWFNPDCPYCERIYSTGEVDRLLKDLDALDTEVVYLAINSTARSGKGVQPKDKIIERSKRHMKEFKADFPVLVDYTGDVGIAYGARSTPHMFVIDTKGLLRYHGAFSDDRSGRKAEQATNYVLGAVKQIESGETVSPDYAKQWGCSIKWLNPEKVSKGKPAGRGGNSKRNSGRTGNNG